MKHFYIKYEVNKKIPNCLLVNYDDDELKIHSTDIYCQTDGHLEEQCKFKQNDTTNKITPNSPTIQLTSKPQQKNTNITELNQTESKNENKLITEATEISSQIASFDASETQLSKDPEITQENLKHPMLLSIGSCESRTETEVMEKILDDKGNKLTEKTNNRNEKTKNQNNPLVLTLLQKTS